MSFLSHVNHWMGYPVRAYDPAEPAPDFEGTIYRPEFIRGRGAGLFRRREPRPEVSGLDALTDFLRREDCVLAPGLVLGLMDYDGGLSRATKILLEHKAKLTNLKGLFLSDIIGEEQEVSWIEPEDVSFVFEEFPGLEHLRLRSGHGFSPARHACLKSLVIESGGLSGTVLESIASSVFPELEHLELFLGTADYGADCTIEQVRPLAEAGRFPKLKYLGIRNADITDAVAGLLAGSDLLNQLEVLDLSLGTLGDSGAEALLASEGVRRLRSLDLHHHYLSTGMVSRFEELGIEVNLDPGDAESYGAERFVAIGE